jgi:hypothetical protein
MTNSDIAAVIAKIPGLNAYGVGFYCGVKAADRPDWLARNQRDLLEDVDGCSRAESWLRDKAKTKTVNRRRSSYGLKHVAEKEVGYITNGAFIAAAIHCGFPYRVDLHSPNVGFGISERSLRVESN